MGYRVVAEIRRGENRGREDGNRGLHSSASTAARSSVTCAARIDEAAGRGGGVDLRPVADEHPQAHPAARRVAGSPNSTSAKATTSASDSDRLP